MTDSHHPHESRLEHIASSLDRFETSLKEINSANAEILDRLTRMEVQQTGQASELHHQHEQIKDLGTRMSKIEIEMAVHGSTSTINNDRLLKRWGLIGAVALVLLGAVGNALSQYVLSLADERGERNASYYERNADVYRDGDAVDRVQRDPDRSR